MSSFVTKQSKQLSLLLTCCLVEMIKWLKMSSQRLKARDGEGVLFVMDGWDELPPELQQQSLFRRLINLPVASSLHRSAVIVTSRPESSAELHSLVSSRIQIVGFTPSEVKEFFTDSLKGDSQAVDTLMEQMRKNPVIESSCYLPLKCSHHSQCIPVIELYASNNTDRPFHFTSALLHLASHQNQDRPKHQITLLTR